jgi:hypothetical protein
MVEDRAEASGDLDWHARAEVYVLRWRVFLSMPQEFTEALL